MPFILKMSTLKSNSHITKVVCNIKEVTWEFCQLITTEKPVKNTMGRNESTFPPTFLHF